MSLRFDTPMPYFGEATLILRAPSREIWWLEAQRRSLVGLEAGVWHTLEFDAGDLPTLLGDSFTDLEVRVVLNVPAGAFFADDLRLGQTDPGGSSGGPVVVTPESLRMLFPVGRSPRDTALAAGDGPLTLGDGVQVVHGAGFAKLSQVGSGGTELGVQAISSSVTSSGDVFLRNNAEIHDDTALIVGQASAYVFERTESEWLETEDVSSLDEDDWSSVLSVSLSDDTAMVSIARRCNVYVLSRATWQIEQSLSLPAADGVDCYAMVSHQNDVAAVAMNTGEVIVFERGPDGWHEGQTLQAGHGGSSRSPVSTDGVSIAVLGKSNPETYSPYDVYVFSKR